MNCRQFEIRIQKLLDERRPLDDRRLRSHARNCSRCRELLQQYRRLAAAFAPDRLDLVPSDGLPGRIVVRLTLSNQNPLATPIRTNRRPAYRLSVLCAVAAATLVLAGLWFGFQMTRTTGIQPGATVVQDTGRSESSDRVGPWRQDEVKPDQVAMPWDDPAEGIDVFSDFTRRLAASPVAWDGLWKVPVVPRFDVLEQPQKSNSMARESSDEPPKKIPTLDEIRAGLSPFAQWVEEALGPVANPWQWWSRSTEDQSRA